MQRFEFQLEKALEWRSTCLKQEEAKLSLLRQEKDGLLRLRAAIEAAGAEAAKIIPGCAARVTGADLALLAACAGGAKSRLQKLAVKLVDCESRIAKQTQVVMQADRQKQLLEDLKRDQFEEWNAALNREVEATASELFLGRWASSAHKTLN